MNKRKKRDNTFHLFQEKKQTTRENIIRTWLNEARKGRARYEYVTDLAKAIAMHIGQMEEGSCSHVTLLRNVRYKTLLLSYMAESVLEKKGGRNSAQNNSPSAQLALTCSKLEISNVRQENQRLKLYIAELEGEINISKGNKLAVGDKSGNGKYIEEMATLLEKYIYTCQTLLLVLERRKDVLEIDQQNKQIIDRSMLRGNKIIVDSSLAEPFFDWYRDCQTSL